MYHRMNRIYFYYILADMLDEKELFERMGKLEKENELLKSRLIYIFNSCTIEIDIERAKKILSGELDSELNKNTFEELFKNKEEYSDSDNISYR